MAVELSGVPKSPHELEDYASALFQSAGYYVEKNITEENILELDAVATSYEAALPKEILVEAKSGGWGYGDIFKLIGWMKYLNVDRGAFIVKEGGTDPVHDPEKVHTKVSPLGVAFIHLGDFTEVISRFARAGFPAITDSLRMAVWRYSYWAERNLIKELRKIAKAEPSKRGPAVALTHHRFINNTIFFQKSLHERLSLLYGAYTKHPRLACAVAMEMEGKPFDPEAHDPNNGLIKEALYKCSHPLLQACFYIEHRARLAILKTAIDYECLMDAGIIPRPSASTFDSLPASFHAGIKTLKKNPFFKRYALFWQVFLWGFGGFYLKDRTEAEFKWLSEQTGIPPDEIPNALKVFDTLFPLAPGVSWITESGPSHCVVVKMTPAPFQGIGVNQRRWRYGYKDFSEFGYGDFTHSDMVRWNNNLVALLQPEKT